MIKIRARRFEIWTDAASRLRRIRQFLTLSIGLAAAGGTAGTPGKLQTVDSVATTDLFDFGRRIDLAPPPAKTVIDATPFFVAVLSGPGTASSWRVVAHGTFNRIEWRLWYAATTTGWRCYETKDAGSLRRSMNASTTGERLPMHDGRAAACAPANTLGQTNTTVVVAGRDGARWKLVGVVFGQVKRASVGFADGSSARLPLDSHTGVFQWSGPGALAPRVIRTDTTTCTLDGSARTACEGVGATVGANLPQFQTATP
jgi:hypothetical protein